MFRIGSLSKALTAVAIGKLLQENQLSLTDPISKYVPYFPVKNFPVTIGQLAHHTGGIRDYDYRKGEYLSRTHYNSIEESVGIFKNDSLLSEPGTKYKFSTYGWILLSAAIEGAAAEPFPTFMRREVFTPLGMDRTALEGSDNDPDTVSFYFPRVAEDSKLGLQDAPEAEYGCYFGAGAFLSTASDLVRLGSAMMKPGFLKKETIELFQTPFQLKSGGFSGFALGWKVDTVPLAGEQVRAIRHRGSYIGGDSSLAMFPDRSLVVATISSVRTRTRDQFAEQVAEAFVASGK